MASPVYSRPIPRPLTTRVREYRPLIEQVVSVAWPTLPGGADWIEIATLVGSGGDPKHVSGSSAQGLLQLPAAMVEELGVRHPFDPGENLTAGVALLHSRYDKLTDVPDELNRLLWSFAAYHGGLRGLGWVVAALKLSRLDIPEQDWWRWHLGKFWLMNRKCNVSYRYPDYRSTWNYVDRIVWMWARGRGA